jgi:hypothetical protein
MKLTGKFPFSKFQRRNIGQKGSNHMRCNILLYIESTVCVNYISVVLLGNYAGTFIARKFPNSGIVTRVLLRKYWARVVFNHARICTEKYFLFNQYFIDYPSLNWQEKFPCSKFKWGNIGQKGLKSYALQKCYAKESAVCFNYISIVL